MKIEEIRANSQTYSTKLSEICRQLCFAGIAVVWIFKVGGDSGGITYDGKLIYPLGAFILALLLDLLQYLYGDYAWTKLGNSMDENNQAEKDVDSKINCPTTLLFYLKVMFVVLGYLFILINIGSQL